MLLWINEFWILFFLQEKHYTNEGTKCIYKVSWSEQAEERNKETKERGNDDETGGKSWVPLGLVCSVALILYRTSIEDLLIQQFTITFAWVI